MLDPHSQKSVAQPLPPLTCEEHFETDPDTGERIQVKRYRRGVMVRETTKSDFLTWAKRLSEESPRQILEMQCEFLRDKLEAAGLPTDRHPAWVKVDDGDWYEETDTTIKPTWKTKCRWARWQKRLEELTEPLSVERTMGELLCQTIQLLGRPGIDKDLWHAMQYAQKLSSFQISRVNYVAHLGMAGRQARAAGPQARRVRAAQVAEIIRTCASACWRRNSSLRHVANLTAEQIKDEVNSQLRSLSLLSRGKNGLSVKTIADYIRKEIRG
jgi:hypothetical protein